MNQKTDGHSRRDKQDEYLAAAKKVGLAALLGGLLEIFRATEAKRKYFHLLDMLARMNLLRIPSRVYELMNLLRIPASEVSAASTDIQIIRPVQEHHIVYVQPNGTDANVISFDDFRGVVERHGDEFARRFAQSLSEWSAVEAGRRMA